MEGIFFWKLKNRREKNLAWKEWKRIGQYNGGRLCCFWISF